MTNTSNHPNAGLELAKEYHARRFFGSLDSIRAVAIVGVVWHHTSKPIGGIPITERGYLGVDLFFVLSGFLIVTLLLREKDRDETINLRSFYTRRALRIFPLFYITLGGLWVVSNFFTGESIAAFRDEWFIHATYTSNLFETSSLLAISWSLSTEEQFYLIWPPIQRFFSSLALPFLGLVIGISQLVNFGVLFNGRRTAGWELGDVTLTPICLGVFAAYILHYRFQLASFFLSPRWMAPALGAATIYVANLPSDISGIVGVHRLVLHLMMTLLIASVAIREDNGLAPILRFRPLARLGAVSYGIYLFHVFVMAAVNMALPWWAEWEQSFFGFGAVFIITVAVAEVSYNYFEKPILEQKARFAAKPRPLSSTREQV